MALSFKVSFCGTLRSSLLHNPPEFVENHPLQCSLVWAMTPELCLCTTPPQLPWSAACRRILRWSRPCTDSSQVSSALCSPPEPGPPLHPQWRKCNLLSLSVQLCLCSPIPDSFSQTWVFDFIMERSGDSPYSLHVNDSSTILHTPNLL